MPRKFASTHADTLCIESPVEQRRKELPRGNAEWTSFAHVWGKLNEAATKMGQNDYVRCSDEHVEVMAVMGTGHRRNHEAQNALVLYLQAGLHSTTMEDTVQPIENYIDQLCYVRRVSFGSYEPEYNVLDASMKYVGFWGVYHRGQLPRKWIVIA